MKRAINNGKMAIQHSGVALRLRQLADLAEVERLMFTVYALYNRKHSKLYIGQTENLKERLRLHKEKVFKDSYTAKLDGEWELIYQEVCPVRSSALLRERQLKSFRGREFLKSYIPA